MSIKKCLVVLCVCFIASLNAWSQVVTKFYPNGDALDSVPVLQNVAFNAKTLKMSSFDITEQFRKDSVAARDNKMLHFGKGFDVSYTLSDGIWEDVKDGRLWSMTIESKDALSLNFVFNDFYLPDGAYMYIVNSDETMLFGPVTPKAVRKNGFFLTDVLQGDKATIFLFEPSDKQGESALTIKRIVHGYKNTYNLMGANKSKSVNCYNDIACFPEYETESDGVGMILTPSGDTWHCGSLVMSTDYSFEPYFLTAFNAFDQGLPNVYDGVLSGTEIQFAEACAFKFRYKHTSCNGSSVALSTTYNGCDFISASFNSDFVLLKLNENVKADRNLTWLGWDRSANIPQSGACIHYSDGNLMEIAFDYDPLQIGTCLNFAYNNHWLVSFDDGVTREYTSGSPLLNGSKRIVGQLTGRNVYNPSVSYCNQPDVCFGRFSESWTGGNSIYTRLSDWLDPISTGQTTMDSHRVPYIAGPTTLSGVCDYYVCNLPSGFTVSWSYTNNGENAVTLQPNVPQQNYCRIDNSNYLRTSITLYAHIYNSEF